MLRLTQVLDPPPPPPSIGPPGPSPDRILTLSFEDRRRSRLLTRLADGAEVALLLPRGTQLRDGTWLSGEGEDANFPVLVRAAAETLSVAATPDQHLLARAAYHLGNRHVPLQIGEGWVAYQHDHVLDDLARSLGLAVTTKSRPFEPEGGGYQHAHHEHQHHHHEHPTQLDHHGDVPSRSHTDVPAKQ